jgi:hypothetical protein
MYINAQDQLELAMFNVSSSEDTLTYPFHMEAVDNSSPLQPCPQSSLFDACIPVAKSCLSI